MPRHQAPKKDVTSCEKLRGAANRQYIRRYPNVGTHSAERRKYPYMNKIVYGGEPGELNHLSTRRKRK